MSGSECDTCWQLEASGFAHSCSSIIPVVVWWFLAVAATRPALNDRIGSDGRDTMSSLPERNLKGYWRCRSCNCVSLPASLPAVHYNRRNLRYGIGAVAKKRPRPSVSASLLLQQCSRRSLKAKAWPPWSVLVVTQALGCKEINSRPPLLPSTRTTGVRRGIRSYRADRGRRTPCLSLASGLWLGFFFFFCFLLQPAGSTLALR